MVAALSLLVVACGGGKKASGPSSSSTSGASSSSSSAATSTTPAPPPIAPLTGLPQPNAALVQRVALVVKVDNADPARPQAGLDDADVVFEEQVEGRLSRLMAVFQSTDSARVGPVRSTRTTDIDVVQALNHPLYSYSGGNNNYVNQLHASTIVDVGADRLAGPYIRSGPHAAPHNLYTRTTALFPLAPKNAGPPPPMFAYRATGQAVNAAGATSANHVDVSFGDNVALWDWDPPSQTWKRGQNGTADVLQDGQQIAAANVIVQFIPYVTDGFATGEGLNPPPPIPKGLTVGTGTALVFTGGMKIPATWSKASPTAVTVFTGSNGQPIQLTPGKTWVELSPVGTVPTIR